MNLIIRAITMVDLKNKEAKRVFFSSGKNLLTSIRNHLGKSVIMKSLYYTLGAEVYYSAPIKRLNLLTYIDFILKNHDYRIARLKNSFVIYCDNNLLGVYPSVGTFEDKLCQLFELEINLVGKDESGTIVKCPPAFYYMPYYIDQENGWSPHSFSFDKLTQFDMPQRKNSYFFHLGALDANYVEVSKRQKTNERQISALEKDNEKYLTVIEILQAGLDDTQMSFDTNSLEAAIARRQAETKKLLAEITRIRTDLVETEDELVQLTHDKEILTKYIKKKIPEPKTIEDEVIECPRCGMMFQHSLAHRLEKAYLIESLHDDYTSLTEKQGQLERKINKLKLKFNSKQSMLLDYEKSLSADREVYSTYVKSKATAQLLKEYHEHVGDNCAEIERLRKDNGEIRNLLQEYTSEKKTVNSSYTSNLSNLFSNLDIPPDQIEDEIEPGSSLVVSGAYGPRCKIAQMLAFVQTKRAVAPDMITFPLVIDSPNALEQDSEHLDSVIRMLLTWDKTDNQIIVASIQGKDTAKAIPDVKIITLDNPKNHLFNSDEYIKYEAEISEIFTQF